MWVEEVNRSFKGAAKIKFFFTLGLFSGIFLFSLLFLQFVKCQERDIRSFLWKQYPEKDKDLSRGALLGFWQCPRWVWVHMADIPVVRGESGLLLFTAWVADLRDPPFSV